MDITQRRTVPESYECLLKQVYFLALGTNPIVFFPEETERIPKLPSGMKAYEGYKGVFYFNPAFVSEELIEEAIKNDKVWALLGFVQKKQEAVEGMPIAVTVCDSNGKEIKTAVVDSNEPKLLQMQAYLFGQWFPDCLIKSQTVFEVIAERLQDSGVVDA